MERTGRTDPNGKYQDVSVRLFSLADLIRFNRENNLRNIRSAMNEQLPIPPTDHGKSLLQWLIPTRRFILWAGMIVLLLILAIFIGLQCWVHYYIKPILRNSYPAYAETKAFWTADVHFSLEELQEIPVSSELSRAFEELSRERSDLAKDADLEYDVFHAIHLKRFTPQQIEDYLIRLEPYMAAGLKLSHQIEKEIQNLSPGERLPIYHDLYPETGALASVFHLKIENRLNNNLREEALEILAALFPLQVNDPWQAFDNILSNLISLRRTAEAAEVIVPFVNSSASLRPCLETINRLRPFLLPDILEDAPRRSLVSKIRHYRKTVPSFDAAPGKPALYYIHQMAEFHHPAMRFTHCLSSWTEMIFLSGKGITDEEFAGLFRPLVLSNVWEEYFYLQTWEFPNSKFYQEVQSLAASTLDRFRLETAARLYELETGKKVSATTDLVPQYIPEEIKDPDTGSPYRWDRNGQIIIFQQSSQ